VSKVGFASTLKSCFRCGLDFHVSKRERVCTACRKPPTSNTFGTQNLSLREKQIIDLVRQAMANKEIAYRLHLTEGTVKEYLNRIFKKLGARNRTEVAVWAMTSSAHPERQLSIAPGILGSPPYLTQ
jgi:DNA-binding NarL/FixJ family response regulator